MKAEKILIEGLVVELELARIEMKTVLRLGIRSEEALGPGSAALL